MDWRPHTHRFQGYEIAFSLPADFVATEYWKDPVKWRTTLALTEQKRPLLSSSVSPLRVSVAIVEAIADGAGDARDGDLATLAQSVIERYGAGKPSQIWQPDGVVPLERGVDTVAAAGQPWVRVVYHRSGSPKDVFHEMFLRPLSADEWIVVSGAYRRSERGDDAKLDERRARVRRIVESVTVSEV